MEWAQFKINGNLMLREMMQTMPGGYPVINLWYIARVVHWVQGAIPVPLVPYLCCAGLVDDDQPPPAPTLESFTHCGV